MNGRNVSLSMLRPIAAALIDVYGQHDYLSIAKSVSNSESLIIMPDIIYKNCCKNCLNL